VCVCLYVCPCEATQLHVNGFSWNSIIEYFSKFCLQSSSFITNMTTIIGILHEYLCTFMMVPQWILLRVINVSNIICKENQKTHFMFINFSKNYAVYETMWKNMVEPNRPQMTIWHMCFACWITKATDTHSEYVILIAYS